MLLKTNKIEINLKYVNKNTFILKRFLGTLIFRTTIVSTYHLKSIKTTINSVSLLIN